MINKRILILLSCVSGLFLFFFQGCLKTDEEPVFQGYVEARYLYLAAPVSGRLLELPVEKGAIAEKNDLIFALDDTIYKAGLRQAKQLLLEAKDKVEDLSKGRRPSEIDMLEAMVEKAKSSLHLSQLEYDRTRSLRTAKAAAQAQLDKAKAELLEKKAYLKQVQANLITARLGARPDQIKAAQAQYDAQQALVTKAQWNLDQTRMFAPEKGQVFDTYYQKGEWVSAGRPIASLLTPDNLKIRFFVPQKIFPKLKLGETVFVSCDAFSKPFKCRISYLSPQVEFTPPVIYSQETRQKLVFMVEAKVLFTDQEKLHPGQPVTIRFNSKKAYK